jgi:hypothetical protein
VNKQIAYLLGISLEADQISVGKNLLYVIAADLVQTGSIEAVLVQQGLSLMDCIFFSCSLNVPAC